MGQFQCNQRTHRLGHHDAQRDRYREFEISIQRKKNHENQQDRQRPDDHDLVLRLHELAIFPAPAQPVAHRQGFLDFRDRLLPLLHRAGQVAPFDAVLHADIPRIIFAIDERRPAAFPNIGQLAQRNLLPGRTAHQQISNLLRIFAEFRMHTHDQVE